ncbi:hypothetical protein WME73_03040 [Sorangium sp. So ce302]|uniref:hypothetical protein n=1 Tax=Sorangium sp. So ce302 TaxID=3133297 RepID=UPI003F5FA8E6
MPLLRHALPAFASTALLASGCGALIGLDEFTDAPAAAGSGGGDTTPCKEGDSRACYEGASETDGVGVCAPGTQTCGADGRWGDCEEQVLPGEEDCNERGDEDCDGVGCSDVAWAKMFGVGPFQWATSVAIGPKGDRIALAGLYRGEINFGPDATTVLPEQSSGGVFLAVFDGEGNHVYSVGLACGDTWPKVALDAESSVLLATGYRGTVNLGGDDLPSSGSSNMLVAKFDQDGVHVWSKSFGDAENRETDLFDMAVAPDGDPVITGFFKGSVTFGGAMLETVEEPDTDGFLVRLNGEDGGHVYSVQIGDRAGDSPGAQYGKGVGVDAMGRAVVAGTFVNSVDFGAGHTRDDLANMGEFSWVAQFDANGMPLWSTTFGREDDGSTVEISGVDVDPAGNAGIVGHFSGTVRFPSTRDPRVTRKTTGVDDIDLFVVRLSAAGTHSWSKQLGDATDQSWDIPFHGVAFDSEGELVFAGGFRGKIDFGGGELTANDTDWLIAKFDALGTHRWSHRYGSGAAFQGATTAAILSGTGDIVVAGINDGAIDLVNPPLTTDIPNVVMARMSP